METNENLLLYDGHCKFCKTSISLLKHWNLRPDIRLETLQSHGKHNADSLELYLDGELYLKSEAIEYCLKSCRNPIAWTLYFFTKLFPRNFKDRVYDKIAASRTCKVK